MTRKKTVWYDKYKRVILLGDELVSDDRKTIFHVVEIQGGLCVRHEASGTCFRLKDLNYDSAYNSVDLKRNEYRLKDLEVYK